MATNRKRTKRAPKSKIPAKISKAYRNELKFKDFMGLLEPQEIEVAKENKILRWDLHVKAGKVAALTAELHKKGYLLAPVYNTTGDIDNREYPEKSKFLIANYNNLKSYKAKN